MPGSCAAAKLEAKAASAHAHPLKAVSKEVRWRLHTKGTVLFVELQASAALVCGGLTEGVFSAMRYGVKKKDR